MPRRKKLPRCIRRHGSAFRAVVGVDGARERSPAYPTIAEAVAWRDAFEKGLRQPADLPDLTLAEGLRLIERDLEASGARAATLGFYRKSARPLFAGLGGKHVEVASVTQKQLLAYIDQRKRLGVEASSIVGKELFVLRRIRRLALLAGYVLPTDPFDGLRTPKVRTGRFGVLTKQRIAELVATMRAAPQRQAAWHADLVELLFATGLRLSELGRVRDVDIDFDVGRISVDGKTGHRYQPFGAALEPVLRRLIAAKQPSGRLVHSYRTVEKLFPAWQKRLGEPLFSAHVMRHSFATEMARHVQPFELMGLMGHSSLTQTSRYFHARGDAVRGALDGLALDRPSRGRARRPADPAPP